ncbi:MAG TPA: histidine phosphatase family protein [Caulobacteraceae bacterium]|jgi:broad specificity phosphatase PhoE
MTAFFITHPEVEIDAAIPVTRWRLSERGVQRMAAFVTCDVVAGVGEVWASGETKAIQAAELLATRFGLPVHIHAGLDENDRSATGFLPPPEFEPVANAFFARPDESVRCWETAAAAQHRILGAVADILTARGGAGDLAIVAHGAVGTLLLCAFRGLPIARIHDQPHQGCYWAFDETTRQVVHGWRPIAPRSSTV